MERYSEALTDFNRVISLKPDHVWAIAHRGETYRQMRCYEEARADFNRAIDLNPDHAWAIAHRAATYRRLVRYEEAIADFNRAIDLKSDYAWAIAYRSVIYVIMDPYEEALAEFDRAIALNEAIASHWGNERGCSLSCLGRYAEAIESCKQTFKARPNDPISRYLIAGIQVRWQGLAEAQPHIDKARAAFLSMTDDERYGADFYGIHAATYGLGGLAALEGRSEEALNYLQEAILLEDNLKIEMVPHDLAWLDLRSDLRFQALTAISK